MNKLRKLLLSDNQILDLTSELGNLVALEEFDISKNGNYFFSFTFISNFMFYYKIL